MSKGQVNIPADLARVFFHHITAKSIELADDRVKALTERAEKAEAIVAKMNASGYHMCAGCNSMCFNFNMKKCGVDCTCNRATELQRYCDNCYSARIRKDIVCGTCFSVTHRICDKHKEFAPCVYDGCEGAPYDSRTCRPESRCPTCQRPVCRRHRANFAPWRCTECQDEMIAFERLLGNKKKRLRSRKVKKADEKYHQGVVESRSHFRARQKGITQRLD
jgi:hypothetical protein